MIAIHDIFEEPKEDVLHLDTTFLNDLNIIMDEFTYNLNSVNTAIHEVTTTFNWRLTTTTPWIDILS